MIDIHRRPVRVGPITTDSELRNSKETAFIDAYDDRVYLITENGIVDLLMRIVCKPRVYTVRNFVDLDIEVKIK